MKTLHPRLISFALLVAATLPAQTHVWIAPGPTVSAADWLDAANWDTGVVPNAPDATAVLTAHNVGLVDGQPAPVTTLPGTAPAVIATGTVDLAELRWQLSGGSAQTGSQVLIGTFQAEPVFSSTFATLRLHGAGFTVARTEPAVFSPPTVSVVNGVLEFLGASSAGELAISGTPSIAGGATATSTIRFMEQASAGSSDIQTGGFLGFSDDATAADSRIQLYSAGNDGGAALSFTGQSGAGRAQIEIRGVSAVDFWGESSAEQARIVAPADSPAGIRTLDFREQSSAGSALILTSAPVTFRDASTAETASISVNGTTLTFADSSTSAGSVINLNPGPLAAPAGTVLYRDQATGGNTAIAFNSDGATLDLSGLVAPGGTTGRAEVNASATASVTPDDGRALSLGRITILPGAAGTRIFLGGNQLVLGENNEDIAALPQLLDGGRFGSAAGDPLAGGGLVKRGTGVLQIAHGQNGHTGETRIEGGELRLVGADPLISRTHIEAAGQLTGTGRIAGDLVNAHGVISPGHANGVIDPAPATPASPAIVPASPVGTLTVAGDLALLSGLSASSRASELVLDVTADGHDRLVVAGTATLGGRLLLVRRAGFLTVGDQTLPLITAGAVTGQFDEVVNSFVNTPLMHARLAQSATGLALELDQQAFLGFAAHPGAGALAAHIDANIPSATGEHRVFLAGLNALNSAGDVTAALDALAPDRYGAMPELAFVSAVARQAERERFVSDGATPGFEVGFAAAHRRVDLEETAGLPAADATVSGGLVGARWRREGFAAALMFSQEDAELDLDEAGSRAEIESLRPALAVQLGGDRFFALASAAFGRDDYDLRRRVVFAGADQTALASTAGRHTELALAAGARWPAGRWHFTPHAGLLASRWKLDSFTESDTGGAALTVGDWSARSVRTRVGLDAAYRPAQGRFAPHLSAIWWHETDDDRGFQARFAGTAQPYAAPGRPAERNLVQVQAGFDWRVGSRAVLHGTLGGAWGERTRLRSDLSVGFRWRF
ncbi:MAG TPA: autotransporter domain-containing protein [Opitutaceae bacterium]|nr:autotransporter domain-containing protein [Opitutaceae bacterium]